MKEEITLTLTIDKNAFLGLNNAIAVYGDIIWGIYLGTPIPDKFAKLKTLSDKELMERFNSLKNLYKIFEKEFDKE